jgi:hypothetical protein
MRISVPVSHITCLLVAGRAHGAVQFDFMWDVLLAPSDST